MRLAELRPLLLLIHGVNSTLEWSDTVLSVLGPHFNCRLVRYRLFHTLWGPIKIYAWPAALLLVVCYAILAVPHLWAWYWGESSPIWDWTATLPFSTGGQRWTLGLIVALLIAEAVIVVREEVQWSQRVDRQSPVWYPPVLFAATGILGACFAGHPWQWAIPVAALVGLAIFLDLREYPSERLPMHWLFFSVPTMPMALVGWLIYDLFERREFAPSWWIVAAVACAGILEPFVRGEIAFARIRQEFGRAIDVRPFVIAHSLGTYLSGHFLRETPELRLGRVLFTGCVLPPSFTWASIAPRDRARSRILAATNYVGVIDYVPLMTGSLRGIWVALTWFPWRRFFPMSIVRLGRTTHWRPLGGAGIAGFVEQPHVVHSAEESGNCPRCEAEGRVRVHNVVHGWASHSTLNKSQSFQAWSWLSLLWGMTADRYADWIETCRLGHKYAQPRRDAHGQPLQPYQPQNTAGLEECWMILRDGPWSWPVAPELEAPAHGQPLEHFVAGILAAIASQGGPQKTLPVVMTLIPIILMETVDAAWMESQQAQGGAPEILGRLHPQAALEYAVMRAL